MAGIFASMMDFVLGKHMHWYTSKDGIKRWITNDMPCDSSNEKDMWKCTKCGRIGTVGRCCGLDTREQVKHKN